MQQNKAVHEWFSRNKKKKKKKNEKYKPRFCEGSFLKEVHTVLWSSLQNWRLTKWELRNQVHHLELIPEVKLWETDMFTAYETDLHLFALNKPNYQRINGPFSFAAVYWLPQIHIHTCQCFSLCFCPEASEVPNTLPANVNRCSPDVTCKNCFRRESLQKFLFVVLTGANFFLTDRRKYAVHYLNGSMWAQRAVTFTSQEFLPNEANNHNPFFGWKWPRNNRIVSNIYKEQNVPRWADNSTKNLHITASTLQRWNMNWQKRNFYDGFVPRKRNFTCGTGGRDLMKGEQIKSHQKNLSRLSDLTQNKTFQKIDHSEHRYQLYNVRVLGKKSGILCSWDQTMIKTACSVPNWHLSFCWNVCGHGPFSRL